MTIYFSLFIEYLFILYYFLNLILYINCKEYISPRKIVTNLYNFKYLEYLKYWFTLLTLWGHTIKTFYQTNTTRQIIETIIESIIVSILFIIGIILAPILLILNQLIIILWELFKLILPLIAYWFIYKIMATSIIEFIGLIPLAIFNTLIILFFLSAGGFGKRIKVYRWRHGEKYLSPRLTYYSDEFESYPWYDVKFRGVCLAEWVVAGIILYLAILFVFVPIAFLIVNAYVLSIKILLPLIISFIGVIVLNFPSDFDVLYMLTCSIIPVKTSKSSKSNTSKPKPKLPTGVSETFEQLVPLFSH